MALAEKYWREIPLREMSSEQWEALCDGCGICCLHKLEDEEDGTIVFTGVACELLDTERCRCANYGRRCALVPACRDLQALYLADDETALAGLPASCAYRRVEAGQELPDWHYLQCGDRGKVHLEGHSVRGKVLSAVNVHPDDYERFVIQWVEV